MSCRLRVVDAVDDFIAGHNAYVRGRRQPGLSPFAPIGASFGFREGWDCALRDYGPPPPPEERVEPPPVITEFRCGDMRFLVELSAKQIVAQAWKMAGRESLDLDKFVDWLREHETQDGEIASTLTMTTR